MTAEVLSESLAQPMPEDVAGWVYDVVLSGGKRAQVMRLCRCQYGACGACLVGRHDLCADARIAGADAYLIGRKTAVRVWRSGTPCRSQCLCDCHKPAVVEPAPELGQMALFELAGGAS